MSKPQRHRETRLANDTPKESLSQHYGGVHAGGWVDFLPSSWIPYIQLARLSPPAALFLIYFPHFFGLLHAANTHRDSVADVDVIRTSLLLFGGSFFFSNAAHGWNDLIDAPIDRLIARTRNRPIARGAISPRAAFIFTASQACGAASFLLFFPNTTAVFISTIPTIIGTTYYPWSKRHTYFPQVLLGFCLAWGIMVGCSALGINEPWKDVSTVCLLLASIIWTVIYDTIYASQDYSDDIEVGVKSIAVLFSNRTKILLWVLLACMVALLISFGILADMGPQYFVISVGGCVCSLGSMIANVELKSQSSCWWWFSIGFWFTGGSIALGLLSEYLLR